MDEAGIRALLCAQVQWGITPGARVVTRGAVMTAGGDVDAVDRYLVDRGARRVAAGDAWQVPQALLTTA